MRKAARSISLAPRRFGPARGMDTLIKEMATNSDKLQQLPDEAFTRESFYQGHD
ncbi:MAG TPA: hypothetical protein VI320_05550 [Terracidiphilus sp.]